MPTKAGRATLADIRVGRTLYHVRLEGEKVFRIETHRVIEGLRKHGGNKKHPRASWIFKTLDSKGEQCDRSYIAGEEEGPARNGLPVPQLLVTTRRAAEAWTKRYVVDSAQTMFEHPVYQKWVRHLLMKYDGTFINPARLSQQLGARFIGSYIQKIVAGYPTQSLVAEFEGRVGSMVYLGDLTKKPETLKVEATA